MSQLVALTINTKCKGLRCVCIIHIHLASTRALHFILCMPTLLFNAFIIDKSIYLEPFAHATWRMRNIALDFSTQRRSRGVAADCTMLQSQELIQFYFLLINLHFQVHILCTLLVRKTLFIYI